MVRHRLLLTLAVLTGCAAPSEGPPTPLSPAVPAPSPATWAISPDGAGPGSTALRTMTDEEARGVRCLRVEEWSEEDAAAVARLDGNRLAVVFAPTGRNPVLPVLPPDLQYLDIDGKAAKGPLNLDALRELPALRFLRFRGLDGETRVDARLLEGMSELRRLDAPDTSMDHLLALGKLTGLRSLDLTRLRLTGDSSGDAGPSLRFLTGMTRLRRLVLSRSTATDFRPLESLPELEQWIADGVTVKEFPSGPMPALRRVRLVGAEFPPENLAAFRAAHPGLVVETSWKGALEEIAGTADRVVLRSGGTCHGREGETILHEEAGVEAVLGVLRLIDVVDGPGGGGCMCCGDPTLEFRRGTQVVAALSLHHAVRLRWREGWPGDARLTDESIEALTTWMAEHGDGVPLEEWRGLLRERRTYERRWALLLDRMPGVVAGVVRAGTDGEGIRLALLAAVPDPVARASVCLRLYGTGEGSWIHPFGPDSVMERILSGDVTTAGIRESLLAIARSGDPAALDGGARWLFAGDEILFWRPEHRATVLAVFAERALGHPRAYNRRRTMEVLARLPLEEAAPLLRRVLRGEIETRTLPEDLAEEYFRGMVPPHDGSLSIEISDAAFAARLLGRLGDGASLETIRRMEPDAPDRDREAIHEALLLLER